MSTARCGGGVVVGIINKQVKDVKEGQSFRRGAAKGAGQVALASERVGSRVWWLHILQNRQLLGEEKLNFGGGREYLTTAVKTAAVTTTSATTAAAAGARATVLIHSFAAD